MRVARRLIDDLTGRWGLGRADILIDALTFPIATGQEETRRDGIETINAIREIAALYPGVNFTLGISNISFGLNPAARQVLNSVFLHECVAAGLTSAIVHASKILPMARIPDEQRRSRWTWSTTGAAPGYDPVQEFIAVFEGVDVASARASRSAELLALPLDERLKRRIIDGERNGLEDDLDRRAGARPALEIINDTLLDGMKVVGELFGSGQMQLPFVLQSAEVMKTGGGLPGAAHREGRRRPGKGRIVLATVKGDVHDIGKNLVDIILSNNGYEVVNIGIKQPIASILDAAESHDADAIGMSGLLVKSTVVMKENLQEMLSRGVAARWPVLLGGAALTRVLCGGRPALALLRWRGPLRARRLRGPVPDGPGDDGQARRRPGGRPGAGGGAGRAAGPPGAAALAGHRGPAVAGGRLGALGRGRRRRHPAPPFFGHPRGQGRPAGDYAALLDERALFLGQWGLRGGRAVGPSYEELVETEGRPRLRYWLDRLAADQVLEASVVYGYFPALLRGQRPGGARRDGAPELTRFSFPRQRQERRLCLADFFSSPGTDSRGGLATGHGRPADQRIHGEAVRPQRVPRLPGGARPLGAADRGPGRVLAPADPLGAGPARRARRWRRRTRRRWRACSARTTAAAATPSATRPAPTWKTARRSSTCWTRPGSACSCRRSSSWIPEQATDAIIVHHPEANYFNAK